VSVSQKSLINNLTITPTTLTREQLINNYGFKTKILNLLESRLEFCLFLRLLSYSSSRWVILLKYFIMLIPLNKSIKRRCLVNIYFLDLISTYKGWRHSKGLPVRGQRTWTNAWSTYKSNTTLREYRLDISKKIYGLFSQNHLTVAYLAEQVNSLWRLQWEREWKTAKKKANISFSKWAYSSKNWLSILIKRVRRWL